MRAGVVVLVLLALAFPVGLAFAVYVTAEPSLAAQPVPAAITQRVIAEPSRTTTEDDGRTTTDDRSGSDRCQEAEHRNDPECVSGGSDDGDDNSGSGSSNSGSGSSNSGSGSDNSGHGGGDD
jgi:uncharacterized membrane protein YgcG